MTRCKSSQSASDSAKTFKTIGRWLHELVDEEFLHEGRDTDGFPVYKPHFNDVWW